VNNLIFYSTPTIIPALLNQNIFRIRTNYHTLALTRKGNVFSFGGNLFGQCGVGTYYNSSSVTMLPLRGLAIDIAVGTSHSLILMEDGSILGFGDNTVCQIRL
jgi:alpha-tubulin suppressor-like RCC1 family protein